MSQTFVLTIDVEIDADAAHNRFLEFETGWHSQGPADASSIEEARAGIERHHL